MICSVIGIIATVFVTLLLRKKIVLTRIDFNVWDLIFLLLFSFFILDKLPFPDSSSDTSVFEVAIGNFAFTDKLEEMKPVLPMFSAWFSLPNRLYYYAREIFGFRGAILLNLFVVVVTYYKIKQLLAAFIDRIKCIEPTKKRIFSISAIISVMALCSLFNYYLIRGAVIQKTDILVIALFFELIHIIISKSDSKMTVLYFGFICGFIVALKLTNIAFIIPFVIWYCIDRKLFRVQGIKWICYAGAIIALVIAPYIMYSLVLTHSPIFPFYNNIFHSPYYPEAAFKDSRWGPHTIIELLLWPIVSLIHPERYSELNFNSGAVLLGVIVSFSIIIFRVKNKTIAPLLPWAVIFIASTFLWGFATGYARYAMFLEIFAFMLLFLLIIFLVRNVIKGKIVLIALFSCIGILPVISTVNIILENTYEWSWRHSIFQENKPLYLQSYRLNLPFLFHDRNATDDPDLKEKLSKVKTWVIIGSQSDLPIYANPEANFFLINRNSPKDPREFADNYFETHSSKDMYVFYYQYFGEGFFSWLNKYGFVVVEAEDIKLNIIDANHSAKFMKVMREEEAKSEGVPALSLNEIFESSTVATKLSDNVTSLYGYYSDGAVAKSSAYKVKSGPEGIIKINGYYPKEITETLTGRVIVNGEEEVPFTVEGTYISVDIKVRPNSENIITIENDFVFQPDLNVDGRELSFERASISVPELQEASSIKISDDVTGLDGYYQDGWVAKNSSYYVKSGPEGIIKINGIYPEKTTNVLTGRIIVNGEEETSFTVEDSQISVDIKVDPNSDNYIRIENDFVFQPDDMVDVREFSFVLVSVTTQ
jgi:hypothetical protein